MDFKIKKATIKDFQITENLTREAFWNIYKPGCDEHLVLHNIRKSECYIPDLDLIALSNHTIVGHVISTKAKIADSNHKISEVLCLGPLSVLPAVQNRGIGSALMRYSIQKASKLGFSGIILYGNPQYYHRFGFKNAMEFGISTKEGLNFDPFMALELQRDGFLNISGRFFEDDVFETQNHELIEFEKHFPFKEKLITDTQLKDL